MLVSQTNPVGVFSCVEFFDSFSPMNLHGFWQCEWKHYISFYSMFFYCVPLQPLHLYLPGCYANAHRQVFMTKLWEMLKTILIVSKRSFVMLNSAAIYLNVFWLVSTRLCVPVDHCSIKINSLRQLNQPFTLSVKKQLLWGLQWVEFISLYLRIFHVQ